MNGKTLTIHTRKTTEKKFLIFLPSCIGSSFYIDSVWIIIWFKRWVARLSDRNQHPATLNAQNSWHERRLRKKASTPIQVETEFSSLDCRLMVSRAFVSKSCVYFIQLQSYWRAANPPMLSWKMGLSLSYDIIPPVNQWALLFLCIYYI